MFIFDELTNSVVFFYSAVVNFLDPRSSRMPPCRRWHESKFPHVGQSLSLSPIYAYHSYACHESCQWEKINTHTRQDEHLFQWIYLTHTFDAVLCRPACTDSNIYTVTKYIRRTNVVSTSAYCSVTMTWLWMIMTRTSQADETETTQLHSWRILSGRQVFPLNCILQ